MTEPIGCCSGCDRRWNNTGQAHCAASTTLAFALGDGDAKLRTGPHASTAKRPPDRCRIGIDAPADRLRAQALLVEGDDLLYVVPGAVLPLVLPSVHRREVRWAVVGLGAVTVVDVLVLARRGQQPMLVGLDVLTGSDAPAQADVPVTALVPRRLTIGDRVPDSPRAHRALAERSPARRAAAALPGGVRDGDTAADAGDRDSLHGWILALQGGCHRHFTVTSAFDLHLGPIPASGPPPCKDPAKVRRKDGTPKLVERDGVWHYAGDRIVEMGARGEGADSPGHRAATA